MEAQRQNWGYRFLKKHEIAWLTSRETLKLQTALSLKDRCQHFLREFPTAHMNTFLLRQIYRQKGIKKKKYRWFKVRKNQNDALDNNLLAKMKRELAKAKREGYRIIYLDETCFTRKTLADTEWALPKENVTVDVAKIAEPCLSLLAAISKEKGIEHYRIFEKSVNLKKYKEWLMELRERNGDAKIYLF